MNDKDWVKKWFLKAKNDLIVAIHVFDDLHPSQNDISCYHCQQSAEKALKGFLIFKDIDPPKTHDLILLCKNCVNIDSTFDSLLEDCGDLAVFATTTRYPDNDEILDEDVRNAINQAKRIYDFCNAKVSDSYF